MFAIGDAGWPGISKLVEEAGEVLQVCGKLMGTGGDPKHWDGTHLKLRLEEEIADLLAATSFVVDHCGLKDSVIQARVNQKRALFEYWQAGKSQPPSLSFFDNVKDAVRRRSGLLAKFAHHLRSGK